MQQKRYYTDIQLSSAVKPGYQPSWRKLFIQLVMYAIYLLGALAILTVIFGIARIVFLLITKRA